MTPVTRRVLSSGGVELGAVWRGVVASSCILATVAQGGGWVVWGCFRDTLVLRLFLGRRSLVAASAAARLRSSPRAWIPAKSFLMAFRTNTQTDTHAHTHIISVQRARCRRETDDRDSGVLHRTVAVHGCIRSHS